MEPFLQFLGSAGIGALALAIVQHILSRHERDLDRRNEELKEAYAGFLNAISLLRSDKDVTEADVNMRYWVARVQLVCSRDVLECLLELEGSKRKSMASKIKTDSVVFAMRRDLGIAK